MLQSVPDAVRQSPDAGATELLRQHGSAIRDNWISLVRQAWQDDATARWSRFEACIGSRLDPLSYLESSFALADAPLGRDHTADAINRVQSEIFMISDLNFEIIALKQAIEIVATGQVHQPGTGLFELFHCLDEFFASVLRDTSNVYEHVSELSARGLCLFDPHGTITYANAKVQQLLHCDQLVGRSVSDR